MKSLIVLLLFLTACATIPEEQRGPRVLIQAVCGNEITVVAVSKDGRVLIGPAEQVMANHAMVAFLREVALEMKAADRLVLMDKLENRIGLACKNRITL